MPGAVCLSDGGAQPFAEGICAALAPLGAACATSIVCKGLDVWCAGGDLGATGVCSLLPGAGEACAPEPLPPAPPHMRCSVGLDCDPTSGLCSALALDPLAGEPCMGTCGGGLTCYGGLCTAPLGIGVECALGLGEAAGPCGAGLICNPILHVCAPACP